MAYTPTKPTVRMKIKMKSVKTKSVNPKMDIFERKSIMTNLKLK